MCTPPGTVPDASPSEPRSRAAESPPSPQEEGLWPPPRVLALGTWGPRAAMCGLLAATATHDPQAGSRQLIHPLLIPEAGSQNGGVSSITRPWRSRGSGGPLCLFWPPAAPGGPVAPPRTPSSRGPSFACLAICFLRGHSSLDFGRIWVVQDGLLISGAGEPRGPSSLQNPEAGGRGSSLP